MGLVDHSPFLTDAIRSFGRGLRKLAHFSLPFILYFRSRFSWCSASHGP
jgi:hypothetical protein